MNKFDLFDNLEKLAKSTNTMYKIGRAPDPVRFMDPEINKMYLNDLNNSRPSDMVLCDLSTSAKLIGLWKPNFQENIEATFDDIPSDIFFSENIPLMDMIMEFNIPLGRDVSETFSSRVFIYPDYHERLMSGEKDEAIDVGIVSFSIAGMDKEIFAVLAAVKGHPYLFRSKEKGHRGFSSKELNSDKSIITVSDEGLVRRINIIMNVWYGVQVALLNPLTKDVFKHGKPVPMNNNKANNNSKNTKKKKVVRYIKRHVINPDDLEMNRVRISADGKKYTRKTMAWYVIGHWRTNKNGTKTFIKGYWKGPLKALKNDNTEVRERELVTV